MIIHNVPYVEDKSENWGSCQGPPSTLMVFRYFLPNKHMSFPKLYNEMKYTHGTWFFETYIVRFLHMHNIPAKYVSSEDLKKIENDEKIFREICGMNFSDSNAKDELDIESYDAAVEYSLSNNLFEKKEVTLNLLKKELLSGKIVIAVVNRNILLKKEGFKGHFMVIKGFDESGFICNDAYLGENLHVTYELFSEAFYRKSYIQEKKLIADAVIIGK